MPKDKKKYIQDKVFNLTLFFDGNKDEEIQKWIGITKSQFELLYQAYSQRGYEWHSNIVDAKVGLFIVLFFLKKNEFSIQELQEFRADATKNSGLQRAETRKKFCKYVFQNAQQLFSYIENNAATQQNLYAILQLIPNRDRYTTLFRDYLGVTPIATPTTTPTVSRSNSVENLTNNLGALGLQSPKVPPRRPVVPYTAPIGKNNNNNTDTTPFAKPPLRRANTEPVKQTKKIEEDNNQLKKYIYKRNDLNLWFKNAKQPHKDVEIEGNNLHLSLQQISNAAFNKFNTPQMQNVIIGNIGFVVSDRPLAHIEPKDNEKHCIHGRKYISFPLKFDLNERSATVTNKKFFDEVPKDQLLNLLNDLNNWAKTYLGEIAERRTVTVPLNDQHSEILICYLLFQEQLIYFLINQLIAKLNQDPAGFRVYSIILDLHSKNSMCPNCSYALLGLLLSNQDNGFLKKVREALVQYGFVKTEKELRLIVRYSFDEKYQLGPKLDFIKDDTNNQNPEKDIKKLFERKAIIHAKDANFWSAAPEKRTGFFSGYRKAADDEETQEVLYPEDLADKFTVKNNN